MAWSWGGRGAKSGTVSVGNNKFETGLGGTKGTVADARSASSWPHYQLQHLGTSHMTVAYRTIITLSGTNTLRHMTFLVLPVMSYMSWQRLLLTKWKLQSMLRM